MGCLFSFLGSASLETTERVSNENKIESHEEHVESSDDYLPSYYDVVHNKLHRRTYD